MAASSSALITAIVVDLIFLFVCFLAFSLLRVLPFTKPYWAPKTYGPKLNATEVKPRKIPAGLKNYFAWLNVLTLKDPEIIRAAGLDTAVYLRLLTFGMELMAYLTVFTCVLQLPVNLTDNNIDTLLSGPGADSFSFTSFDKCGLANVSEGSPRMWLHMLSVYVILFIAMWMLNKYSREFALLRMMYIASQPGGTATHTILVSDIPAVWEDSKTHLKQNKIDRKEHHACAKPAKPNEDEAVDAADVKLDMGVGSSSEAPRPPPSGSGDGSTTPLINREALRGTFMAPPERTVYTYDTGDKSLMPDHLATTIMSAGVPATTMVENEFDTVYPGQIRDLQLIKDQGEMWPLYQEYTKVKLALDDYVDEQEHRISTGKKVVRNKALLLLPSFFLGDWGKANGYGGVLFSRPDAFEYYTARLQELERLILAEQTLTAQLSWPSAFVTFKSRREQIAATVGLHHHDTRFWLVRPAPEPRELVWNNLGLTLPVRTGMWFTMWVVFWLGCAFFMIPVAAVQALIESASRWITDSSAALQNLLEGVIPGIALVIFVAMVPALLRLLMYFSGAISESEVDMGVVFRFFLFQLIVVFFGTIFGGTFFSQFNTWIKDPGQVISILGTAIPQVCTFFITYVLARGLLVNPLKALRIVPVIIYAIMSYITPSPKARARIWQLQYSNFGQFVATHTNTVLLGLVYSCINPIMTPACLAYFIVSSAIERYEQVYVVRRRYESAGMMWPQIFHQIMTALYVQQLVMIGLLGIKKFEFTPLLIPAPVITILFHASLTRLYSRPWAEMSYHDGVDLDRKDTLPVEEDDGVHEELLNEGDDVKMLESGPPYLSPCFKVREGGLASLLQQSRDCAARVDATIAETKANGGKRLTKGGMHVAATAAEETAALEAAADLEEARQLEKAAGKNESSVFAVMMAGHANSSHAGSSQAAQPMQLQMKSRRQSSVDDVEMANPKVAHAAEEDPAAAVRGKETEPAAADADTAMLPAVAAPAAAEPDGPASAVAPDAPHAEDAGEHHEGQDK
ncbi:hypothetical protein FOA52_014369 [Chlamydomonas sp. UWO 241]|nr:hypothetical protein FOA52_014369 [Chlamydomonas sp. UWO 241]